MATHRFVVNVPNPAKTPATVQLTLEPADPANLGTPLLDAPSEPLEIRSATLALEPCADGRGSLKLRLAPYASVDVHVTVVTADPADPNTGGLALLHLVDRRAGKVAGGVLLGCVDPARPESSAQIVTIRGACPATLTGLYVSAHPTDPTKRRSQTCPADSERALVAAISNPTSRPLAELNVYLEHLGRSGAEFVPQAWNVGALQPGDTFYATWTITTHSALSGSFDASIVASSRNRAPARLHAQLIVGPRERPRPKRKPARPRRR